MNKLEELEKKYEELGKEIEKLKKEDSFVAGYYMYWDDEDVPAVKHIYFVDDKSTHDDILKTWPNVKPVTPKLMEFFYQKPKTTIYDWSKIPKEYNWAVINENGDVHTCGCIDKPIINEYATGWRVLSNFTYGWKNFNKSIIINPVDDWTKSCEHRPEQE